MYARPNVTQCDKISCRCDVCGIDKSLFQTLSTFFFFVSGHAHFDVKRIFIYQERGDQVLISYPTQAARSATNLQPGRGLGGGEEGRIRLGILGGCAAQLFKS